MIQLTRLRHGETFFLNPDLFERVDTHVDTVVRLTDGTEYLVVEPAEEIVRRIVEFRARVIAIAGMIQANAFAGNDPVTPEPGEQVRHELAPAAHPTPTCVEEPS